MNLTPRAVLHRIVLLVVSFLCASPLQAQEPPDKIQLDYYRGPGAPLSIRGYDNHVAYLVDSVSVTGKKWTGLLRVSSPQHGSIYFPTLKKDEIVPVFGALYHARLGELVRLKDAPKGLALAKDSFVVPLMRDEQGSGQITYRDGNSVSWKMVCVITITPGVKGEKPVARVKIDDIRTEARDLRVGDVLKLGPTEWDVRSIVPAGDGVIGWVELGPKKK